MTFRRPLRAGSEGAGDVAVSARVGYPGGGGLTYTHDDQTHVRLGYGRGVWIITSRQLVSYFFKFRCFCIL